MAFQAKFGIANCQIGLQQLELAVVDRAMDSEIGSKSAN
jgi:hypothetical protein